MLVTKQQIFRRFWYAMAPVDKLKEGPLGMTLMGEKLVLWLDPEGNPVCMRDRCCHRTMKLSKGWIKDGNIVCPYHGWAYDAAGQCVHVPQSVEPARHNNYRVERFRCAEKYGLAWVALEDPIYPIPDLPQFGDPEFRIVPEFFETWRAPGLRIMENSFDNAHFSFVHKTSFGINEEPAPAQIRIEDTPDGFNMFTDVPVKNPEIQKKNLNTESDRTIRHTIKTWWMPFSRRMFVRYPNGLIHIICTLTAPIDDRDSNVIQFVLRNDTETDAPAADVVAFDRQVTFEDRSILEECDWDVPLNLNSQEEAHMASDRPGILMRRRLAELLAQYGESEIRLTSSVQ